MHKETITNIAHRGAFFPEGPIATVKDRYEVPENTLAAFEKAFQNGWGIETDIRVTGDGGFVVIHDGDIVRFSGQEGVIDQMTASQIQEVDYKNKPEFQIPTLDSLCTLAQKYGADGKSPFVAFQVKRGSALDSGVQVGRAVADRMQKFGLKDSILFDATLEEAEVLRGEFPWMNLSVSVGERHMPDAPTIYTIDQIENARFRAAFNCIWADEWNELGAINNKDVFERMRRAVPDGRIDVISPELHFDHNHPLSRPEQMNELVKVWKDIMSWNIADGICTDYPTELQKLM